MMKINLSVHLDIEGNRLMQSGEFQVRKNEDIPAVAYQWIRQIKRDTGHRETIITKVIWNDENDITDTVKKIDETLLNG